MEIKTIINSFVDLFFPMRCINCQEVIQPSQFLCTNCSAKLPFTNWKLNQDNVLYHKLKNLSSIEAAYSLFYFKHNSNAQKIIHEMKYKNRPDIGIDLANYIDLDLFNYDGIIPIPLHTKRLKKRGYNQVGLFAETLAQKNGIPYYYDGLIRTKHNSSQVKENKKNRINNLMGAFDVNQNLLPGHYILIDDVVTTGATLASAIKKFNVLDGFKITVVSIACA